MKLPILRAWRYIMICLLFSACVKPIAPAPVQSMVQEPADGPKILFINYKITAPEPGKKTDTEQVICLSHFLVPGTLKPVLEPPSVVRNAQYACLMQNERKETLKKIELASPLEQVYEYVNEDHKLEQKVIIAKEAEFSLRTQLVPDTRYVLLVKYLYLTNTTILNTLEIQRL